MKNYIATFWRSNPQLANGGYETERKIEARSIAAATKKAEKIKVTYGGLEFIKIEEMQAAK